MISFDDDRNIRVATVLEIREASGKVERAKIVRERSGNLRK